MKRIIESLSQLTKTWWIKTWAIQKLSKNACRRGRGSKGDRSASGSIIDIIKWKAVSNFIIRSDSLFTFSQFQFLIFQYGWDHHAHDPITPSHYPTSLHCFAVVNGSTKIAFVNVDPTHHISTVHSLSDFSLKRVSSFGENPHNIRRKCHVLPFMRTRCHVIKKYTNTISPLCFCCCHIGT